MHQSDLFFNQIGAIILYNPKIDSAIYPKVMKRKYIMICGTLALYSITIYLWNRVRGRKKAFFC